MAARLRTALEAGIDDGTLPGLTFTQDTAANAIFAASGSQWMFHSVVGAVLPG